jgi:outer membrane receptor protein involved in Fe transport
MKGTEMKVMTLIIVTIITGLTSARPALPSDDGIIKGVVFDSTAGSPLAFANVTLHNSKDSNYITGTSTGTAGEFLLPNVAEGDYLLKISYMGYSNKYIPGIKINGNKSEVNTGKVMLSKTHLELSEMNIVGERASEELHLDKKVINVSQNLTAAGGTALDVLQNQPSVRVDPDGSVYLRGSSNFTVLVNGKPGVLQGSDALRQLPANMIENIELITNPSAKYDAEGVAGIININLRKQTDYNISGIANLNGGTKDKYNGDFTLNYNVNGLNLTGGVDYRDNSFTSNQYINRTSFSPIGTTNNSSGLFIRDKRRQFTGRTGMDYNINERNSLSLNVSSGKIDVERLLSVKVTNNDPSGELFSNHISNLDLPIFYINSTANYNHKFVPGVNDVMLELTYSAIDLPSEQLTNEYATDQSFTTRSPNPRRISFDNDASRKEGRAKLNYTHKINPASTFETGVQTNMNYRTFDILNRIYNWDIPGYVTDNNLTNNFKMWSNVYSGFATYSNQWYEFNFMLGLRGEYMYRLLEQTTMGNDYKFEKMDYFPSFSVSRKISDHQLQLSYSRRINRPNENLLNPFPFYSDSYFTSAGNPQLLPEYINSLELNYQKMFGNVFTSVQTYYRNSDNSIQQKFSVDNNGRMSTTFDNFARTKTYGSEISGSFTLLQILRFDPAVNLFGTELTGSIDDLDVNKSFFNWSARLNSTITITPDTRFQLSGNYFAKMINAQADIKSFLVMNASLRQDFLDKKFSATLQARNFLRTAYMNISNRGANFFSNIEVRPEIPVISLMLSYNFNNFKRAVRPADNIDVPTGI